MICTFKYCFISLKESEKSKTFLLDQGEGNTFFMLKSKQPWLKAIIITQFWEASIVIFHSFKTEKYNI